jgi:hypothetical protein
MAGNTADTLLRTKKRPSYKKDIRICRNTEDTWIEIQQIPG